MKANSWPLLLDLAAHELPSPLLVNATMTAGYCSWLLGKLDVAEAYMQRALALDEVIGHRATAPSGRHAGC